MIVRPQNQIGSKGKYFPLFLLLISQISLWNLTSVGAQPLAFDDFTQVSEDVSVRINVLKNDDQSWSDFNLATLRVMSSPIFGQAWVDGSTIVYKPYQNFFGKDSFNYEICNLLDTCHIATVRITIHAVTDPPIARDDLDTVDEDGQLILYPLLNDEDLDNIGNLLSANDTNYLVEMPKHGGLEIFSDYLIYRPKAHYFGNDYFKYALCNGIFCDTAIGRIHVRAINDPPQANDDFADTYRDLLLVMDPLLNDHDSIDRAFPDRSSLSIEGMLTPAHGFSYVDRQVGLIIYVPHANYIGLDSFSYRICDFGPDPVYCDSAMIYIVISDLASSLMVKVDDTSTNVEGEKEKGSDAPMKDATKDDAFNAGMIDRLPQFLQGKKLVPGRYGYFFHEGSMEILPYLAR